MAKINYESGEFYKIDMNGNGAELFKGVCRIAAHLKGQLGDVANFEDLLIKGIHTADKERKIAEELEGKEKVLDEILDLLKGLIND